MARFGTWASNVASLALAVGCGTSSAPANSVTANTTTAAADTSSAAQCGKSDDGSYGKKVPWQGFALGAKAFACNVCRGGYPNLQGSWRFVDFGTEDPSTPVSTLERLDVDGNTWTDRIRGQEGGKTIEQTLSGWYFCTDPSEMPSMDAVFVIEKAEPDGAFGNTAGSVFRASVKVKVGSDDQIALGLSNGLDGPFIGEFAYCKVGSSVAGKPCTDPFAAP